MNYFVLCNRNHSHSGEYPLFFCSRGCHFMCVLIFRFSGVWNIPTASSHFQHWKNERFRAASPNYHQIFILNQFQCQFTIQRHIHRHTDTAEQQTSRHILYTMSILCSTSVDSSFTFNTPWTYIQSAWCLLGYDTKKKTWFAMRERMGLCGSIKI